MKPINGILESEDSLHTVGGMQNFIAREGRKYFDLHLYGMRGAKKDRLTPSRKGMHIGTDLRAELNDLEMQVPGELRDLQLEHPDLMFVFHATTGRRDKDGMVTTILDILVKCGTLVDDNIQHCNGTWVILPATLGTTDEAHVRIYPR